MLFNVKLLTLATKEPLEPLENALTSVDTLLYPMPGFVTIASITCPFSMTGLTTAPAPVPVEVILISGLELYEEVDVNKSYDRGNYNETYRGYYSR